MKNQGGIIWLPIIVVSLAVLASALTAYLLATQETGSESANSSLNTTINRSANSNTVLNANNALRDNSNRLDEGDFRPVNNDPNANTNLTNISPQTNANTSAANSKSCTSDADCGLLVCNGCFSNDYLKTVPPDLACRTYDGYRCACVSGQCLEVE